MKNIRWLIEYEVFEEDANPLIAGLHELGILYSIVTFGTDYENYIKKLPKDDIVVFYGSLQFAKVIKNKTSWPLFCNLPKYECTYYYPRFGDCLLNHTYMMVPFGDLTRQKALLFKNFAVNDEVFMRPSSGNKSFTGAIFNNLTWDEKIKNLSRRIDSEELVVVAPPRKIFAEYRAIIIQNKIIGISQYKKDDKIVRIPNAPPNVIMYGQQILENVKYKPDMAWTLDICETENNFAVLEVGSFSCSGLYAAEPKPIIKAINQLVKEIENE